jgi:hypothetical protein
MFEHAYNLSGGRPLIMEFLTKDTETLTEGDLTNLESGEVDLAATNDAAFVGVLVSAVSPDSYSATSPAAISAVDSTTKVRCVVNEDAVYRTADANARLPGVNLDIAGATGAQTVAADSNHDFLTVLNKGAAEATLVKFAVGESWLN